MAKRNLPAAGGARRPKSEPVDSEESFAIVGDRVIEAVRHMRRSPRNKALQRDLYTVGGYELTPVQVDMLEILATRKSWRMSEMAAACGVDPSTITRTFAPLVDLGLAERTRSPLDGRLVIVAATAGGIAQVERIADARRGLMRAVLSRLPPDRRILLADLLEAYMGAVDAEAEDREKKPGKP